MDFEEYFVASLPAVTVSGTDSLGGTYILRIYVLQDIQVVFGHFQSSKPVLVPAGEMLYLGSAMRGLASRVLRHGVRTADKPAHALYKPLLSEMKKVGLINGRFQPPTQKKLHWHIDYLLDEAAVYLTHAILIRSQERLENKLGNWLLAQPETAVLLPGLGASDIKGHTHLLQIQANSEQFWERLLSFVT